MIVKNEVELHQNSVDYVKEVFSMYTEVYDLNKHIKNPIIHIYPVEDTYDQNGELNGYIDALFFKMNIYDTENMTVYKSEKLHDGILPFDNLHVSQIKIFKDLSTMIVLRGKYTITDNHLAVDIYNIK
ncbi:hypothetical protein [Bacillus xiapuensis]|uniref:Uncharacterized protein n=1 Tax=Bacillus xiapuensis TaxID=2014075 RepID=A0ABU6N835_9BACI|nr:hypothetical protein [Bacillus xiapuensis]